MENDERLTMRKKAYEEQREALIKKCQTCIFMKTCKDPCYDCTTGRNLRELETSYSDVTGWSHDKWYN